MKTYVHFEELSTGAACLRRQYKVEGPEGPCGGTVHVWYEPGQGNALARCERCRSHGNVTYAAVKAAYLEVDEVAAEIRRRRGRSAVFSPETERVAAAVAAVRAVHGTR